MYLTVRQALSFAGFGTTFLGREASETRESNPVAAIRVISEGFVPIIGAVEDSKAAFAANHRGGEETTVRGKLKIDHSRPLMPKYGFTNTTPTIFGRPFTRSAIRSQLQADFALTALLLAQMGVGSLLALWTGLRSMFWMVTR
jgi:hypothetical protein